MAMAMDQQKPTYKHYCRVCKKGFGCGPALGGHMRAHGINEEPMESQPNPGDDGPSAYGASDGDADDGNKRGTKRMYALRANPIRLKSCRVCENCGEEFLSWKAFLEHGRCSSKDGNGAVADEYPSLASPLRSEADEDLVGQTGGAGWSKGKRSRRVKVTNGVGDIVAPPPRCTSSEEEDLANCLVMLSAAPMSFVETEESCGSASKEETRDLNTSVVAMEKSKAPYAPVVNVSKGMFECKACKKVFTSHQALGGHRASHKKVKGCFAANLDEHVEDNEVIARNNAGSSEAAVTAPETSSMEISPFHKPPQMSTAPLKKKSRVHECSICHRVFTSGQALGGHKRRHWITSNVSEPGLNLPPPMPDHGNLHRNISLAPLPTFENVDPGLDLNLPAAADNLAVVPQGDIGSPLRLDVPAAAILLQRWFENSNSVNNKRNEIKIGSCNNVTDMGSKDKNSEGCNENIMDEEVESKIKLAKLSELKEINLRGGESSPWLQVGIGSAANDI